MRDIVLLLDVDGPLGDFHSEARNVANTLFNLELKLEDFNTWDVTDILPTQEMKDELNAAIAKPGFATRILPQSGSQDGVRALKEICEVVFATTPHAHSPTWMRERQDWLHHHYGVAHDEIIHAFRKHHIRGDLLIDDRPKTIRRWESVWSRHGMNAHGLLWDMPYNRMDKGFKRVRTWQEVIRIVEDMRSENLITIIPER